MKLRGSDNVKRSFTKQDKKGREETWEWEETPEAREAIKKLHESSNAVTELATPQQKGTEAKVKAPSPPSSEGTTETV
tara:strand:- start:3378 stop:3611 length:234 start_codon:yes stop_codon:yes gene_type:complete